MEQDVNNSRYTVYCLAERAGCWRIRYVGITKQRLQKRLHGHLWDAKRQYRKEHKSNWIRKCVADCVPIRIRAIRSNLTLETACVLERSLIDRYRSQLVNIHEGGTSGYIGLPNDAKQRHADNTRIALESVYAKHGGKEVFYANMSMAGVQARERNRMARSHAAVEVGVIRFTGRMFGGEDHVIRLLSPASEERYLLIEIDGVPHRPTTARGIVRLIARRLWNTRKQQ